MFAEQQGGGRRGAVLVALAATALLLAVVGAVLIGTGLRGATGPAPASGNTSSASVQSSPAPRSQAPNRQPRGQSEQREPSTDAVDFGPVLPGAVPVALDIPSIAVHSTELVDLGLAPDGTLEVPSNAASPGWFSPGPSPGQIGPAIIVGHVDSETGPAVFYRLGELVAGDRIKVTRDDGSVAAFVIDRVKSYDKDEFPTRQVYGSTDRAELRLITCSGEYDEELGYLGNTVAFGHLAG